MTTKLIPSADKIVIKPIIQDDVLESGIVIPEVAKKQTQQGEIIAAGPGRVNEDGKLIPMEYLVGERVLYAKYSGQEIKIDNIDFVVLTEKDILCRVQIEEKD